MADKPITREEKYLAYLTGDYTGELPKPITRKEKYLYELCLKGMGGEVSPEEIKNAVNEYLEKNPVKPGATTEQAQQIEQNKTDVASLKEDLSNKITKFYASNQGETHLQDSDNGKIMDMMIYGKASQDGTPSPENPVEIKSVVNPTVKVSNEDGVESQTVTLPYTLNAIPVSSGGNVTIDGQQYVSDYVDVERGKRIKMVGEVDLGSLDWTYMTNYTAFSANVSGKADGQNMLCSMYVNYGKAFLNSMPDMHICANSSGKQIFIKNSKYTDADAFKQAMPGAMLYYKLATPEEIDLTDEEVQALKALATYYPTTNISINSEQLDGYTVFNYPISMQNGWNYVKQQLNDNRDYIYDMDLQSAEAYVNSEYAVALTELEV